MSIVRVCDCDCHEHASEIPGLMDYATFGGKDICEWCLDGITCGRWIPRVLPEPTELQKLTLAAYEQALLRSLRSQPLFREVSGP